MSPSAIRTQIEVRSMNESFLLLLSSLLHLHTHLDPSTSLLSSGNCSAASDSLLSSSAATPLILFAIAAAIASIAATPPPSPLPSNNPQNEPVVAANASDYGVSAFRALVTERIWGMEAPLRDAHWRSCYGISYPLFTTVVEKLRHHIAAANLSLPSDYALAMVLSRLAHGLSAAAVAARHSLEPYLVCKITNMVTRLLATRLYPEYIKIPVGRRRLSDTIHGFHLLTSLPNMCGAIDTTPVPLHYRRRSHSSPADSSLLLQVVADHRSIFWDVCVRANSGAAVDDASNLRSSLLYSRLTMGDVVWDKAVNVSGHPVRPYVVGDRCFPLLGFLLTPYGGGGGRAQNLFDAGLMKGRSVVVDAIGLLKGRWRMLQEVNVGVNHAAQTIVACCVLHNLCQIASEPEPEPWKGEEEEDLGHPPEFLESEMTSHYVGESSRTALADDMLQRFP